MKDLRLYMRMTSWRRGLGGGIVCLDGRVGVGFGRFAFGRVDGIGLVRSWLEVDGIWVLECLMLGLFLL